MMTSLCDDDDEITKMFWTQFKSIVTKQSVQLELNAFRGRNNKDGSHCTSARLHVQLCTLSVCFETHLRVRNTLFSDVVFVCAMGTSFCLKNRSSGRLFSENDNEISAYYGREITFNFPKVWNLCISVYSHERLSYFTCRKFCI